MSKPSQQTFQQALKFNEFTVFGHRGLAGNKEAGVYENTPGALRLAVQQGAGGIEADAWFLPNGIDHQDGEIVVYHDEQYGVGAEEKPTPSWTVPTIREYDPKRRNNLLTRVPLLSEFVELFKEFPNLLFNLELKRLESQQNKKALTREDNQLVEQSLRILCESGIQDRVIISSFDIGLLEEVRNTKPEIARAVLVRREDYPEGLTKEAAIELLKRTDSIALNPYYKLNGLTSLVPELTESGYSVIPWTFRRSQEIGDKPRDFFTELVNAGICGLITDDPGYYLGRYNSLKRKTN